jgi:hypothetical protein
LDLFLDEPHPSGFARRMGLFVCGFGGWTDFVSPRVNIGRIVLEDFHGVAGDTKFYETAGICR